MKKRCQRCQARQRGSVTTCNVCGDLPADALAKHARATLSARGVYHLGGVVGVFVSIGLFLVATLPLIAVSPVAAAIGLGVTLSVFTASVYSLEQGKLYRWLKTRPLPAGDPKEEPQRDGVEA